MALAAYASEYSIPQLSGNQLDIAAKVITVLSPIEELTKAVSAESSCLSLIIPFVRMLTKTLEKSHDDRGVQTVKGEMIASIKKRFTCVEENHFLAIATMLDPRFKDKFFSNATAKVTARTLLQQKKQEIEEPESPDVVSSVVPSPKRPRTDLWESVSEILEEAGSSY